MVCVGTTRSVTFVLIETITHSRQNAPMEAVSDVTFANERQRNPSRDQEPSAPSLLAREATQF